VNQTTALAEFVFVRKSDFVAHAFTPLGMSEEGFPDLRSMDLVVLGVGSLKTAPHLGHFQFFALVRRYIWLYPHFGQLGIIFSLNSKKDFKRSFALLLEVVSELTLSVDVLLIVRSHSVV